MPDDLEMCIKETAHFPRILQEVVVCRVRLTRGLEHAATVTVGPRLQT
jgi:hypothetical protein